MDYYFHTYQYMLGAVKLGYAKSIDDFNEIQRQEILSALYEDQDQEGRLNMCDDMIFDSQLIGNLINYSGDWDISYKSPKNKLLDIMWSNSRDILEDVFDKAEVDDFKERGGMTEDEEHRLLDAPN
jgi:hypothetical protein